jgi:phasin
MRRRRRNARPPCAEVPGKCNNPRDPPLRRIAGAAPRVESQEAVMAKDPFAMGNFEIPTDVRKFAEQSVEQARRAFEGFITAGQKAAGMMEGQAAFAQSGAKDLQQRAITFAEQNVATSFDFAQKLVQAKTAEEVMRLQTEYVRAQMQALAQQAQELGQTAAKAAMDAAKPKF